MNLPARVTLSFEMRQRLNKAYAGDIARHIIFLTVYIPLPYNDFGLGDMPC